MCYFLIGSIVNLYDVFKKDKKMPANALVAKKYSVFVRFPVRSVKTEIRTDCVCPIFNLYMCLYSLPIDPLMYMQYNTLH